MVEDGIQDLNDLAIPAFGIRDPNKGQNALEEFQLGVFKALGTIALGDSASRAAARSLKAAAYQIQQQSDELQEFLRISGVQTAAAAIARAGAVGFEAAGTPRTVAKETKLAAQTQRQRINQATALLVGEILRRARRIEKARKRRKNFAILNTLRHFFEDDLIDFIKQLNPSTIPRVPF